MKIRIIHTDYENIPPDFIPEEYTELNDDLQNMSEKEAKKHYEYNGYKEKRKYKYENIPPDFIPEEYIELNDDLQNMSEKEAKKHYEYNGYKEKRKYIKTRVLNEYEESDTIVFEEKYSINNNLNYSIIKPSTSYYDAMNSENLLITRKFLSNKTHENLNYKINNDILNTLNEFIFVLDFPNGGGGTTFFINTIVSKYKNNQTFVIARNYDGLLHLNINEELDLNDKYEDYESILFLDKYKDNISKIFVNHLLNHSNNFINKIKSLNKEIITITHDYYNICNISQPYYHEITKNYIIPKIQSDIIITQNEINILTFGEIYKQPIHIINLPDYKKSDIKINNNNTCNIVVGIIGNIIDIKGKQILEKLINIYKNTNIKIIVIGYTKIHGFNNYYCYNSINEFNAILVEHKPNILLELSLWPETYSYTLTLSMLTQLPILCLNKNFKSVIQNRLNNYSKKYYFSTFLKLDKLIKMHSQNYLYTVLPILYYNNDWDKIFLTKTKLIQNININHKFIHNIKPYFIYFPQFHKIKENDLFFYENFSDIQNLKMYNKKNYVKLETPLLDYLNIDSIDNYDLTNLNIIQKQIDLINYYKFSGIAMYYYWFSKNTITNKNQIMNTAINNFFDTSINMYNSKIFFIWANENWSDNRAFGINEKHMIINEYTEENFIKNSNILVEYFKNDKYLKIDNKPVFFIYHNHLIENIDVFYNILNDTCIKNNFKGISLVLNSFTETNQEKYPKFYINFNYKRQSQRFYDNKSNQIKLDYDAYLENDYHFKKNCIQTIATDFNNKPRLFIPDKLNNSTICINNSEINKLRFIRKIIDLYNNFNNDESSDNELNKILLVNSFNEWGENMAYEPSQKYEYYNLNLLFKALQMNKDIII